MDNIQYLIFFFLTLLDFGIEFGVSSPGFFRVVRELMGHHTVFHCFLMGVSSNNLIAPTLLPPAT